MSSDLFRPADVVAALDDGQRFRVSIVADHGELIVTALDGPTAGESGVVLVEDVRLLERPT